MINANELRIGNLVFVGRHTIVIDEIHSGIISSYDPIPLTPEILEKCGFENQSAGNNYYFIDSELVIGGDTRFCPGIDYGSGLDIIGSELKSLHQLQNLYFALTGKELEVNL